MRAPALLLAVALALGAAACEHPIGVVTPHAEVADLLVADPSGTLLARTELNRSWSVDSLLLHDGRSLAVALTALDFRGEPVDLHGRSDLSFRVEAEDGALLQWEPRTASGGFLHPFGAGATRIRFLVWHGDHADFVTPWLRVRVVPAGAHDPSPEVGR